MLISISRALQKYSLPIALFVLCLFDEPISKLSNLPSGLVTTLADISLSLCLLHQLKQIKEFKDKRIFLIPIFLAVGDLFYGLSNYILKLPFANHTPCLLYVIPYIAALILISFGLYKLARFAETSQKGILGIGLILSLGIFAFTTINIIIPALFYKTPALDPLLKTLTVIFSVLESGVIGLTLALLLCANCKAIQIALFGSLFMHVSDIAIRYESVKLDLMGTSVFDYGWGLGLAMAAIAAKLYRDSKHKNQGIIWLPLRSIRGMTIVFILTGFLALWVVLGFYYQHMNHATESVSTLLIVLGSFSFSVLVADFVTNHVTGIVQQIENKNDFKCAIDSPFIPYEIKVIATEFEKKNEEIKLEKDRVLNITSSVSHDLRSPLGASKHILASMKSDLSRGTFEQFDEYIRLFESCVKGMQKTASDLLNYRKEVLEVTSR